jgi:hypothetical protein
VVSRLSLDHLRSARVRRETCCGTGEQPDELQAGDVTTGFLGFGVPKKGDPTRLRMDGLG